MSAYTEKPRLVGRERHRYMVPRWVEAFREWSCKPFTPLAECVTAAVAGTVMFALFAIVGLSV